MTAADMLAEIGAAVDRAVTAGHSAAPVTVLELRQFGRCALTPAMIGAAILHCARARVTLEVLPRGERSRVTLAELLPYEFQTPGGRLVEYRGGYFEPSARQAAE